MLANVIDRAVDLTEEGQGTVDGALERYAWSQALMLREDAALWVSVAFLLARHGELVKTLPV